LQYIIKSQYYGVRKIQKDQFENYVQRKGLPKEEMERWLSPLLE